MVHTLEQNEEKPKGLKGKLIAFFDIEQDPLVQKFKKKIEPEPEKKEDWVYTR